MTRPASSSPRMSDNPFIEFLTRTRWWASPAVYLPIVVVILTGTVLWGEVAWWAVVPLAAGGAFAWTFYEYCLHRFLFHWTPPIPGGARIQMLWHGIHHERYDDPLRIVISPLITGWLALILLVPHLGVAWLLADWIPFGAPIAWFAGTLTGWVGYSVTHWALHCHPFKSKVMRQLRAHHMLHHVDARYADARYGVTTTLWDRVFGTMEPERQALTHRFRRSRAS
jgi:dihydroceramide fatty acyl 2-hydroxylase